MLFSPQKWFCTVCGKEQNSPIAGKATGPLACSAACYREFRWRETLSIFGKSYYPYPEAANKDPQ